MATITPTLTLTSNASTASSTPGPLSIALSVSATDALDVTEVQSKIVDVSGTHANLWDASDFTSSGTAGTDGAFLYFKNIHATVNIMIGAATLENLSNDGEADRLFTLKPSEFAWMPWDCTTDICVDANGTGTSGLEAWCFVRTGTA